MKISIIVSIFNSENYLHRCLDSIVNQSYMNLEIILVNAGSTDSSGEIIDEYSKIDKRILAIHMEHCGIGAAFKVAIEHVTGDYITFVDSDDYLELTAYEELIYLVEKEDPDFVHFGITTRNPEGIVVRKHSTLDAVIEGNTEILLNHFTKLKHPILVRLFKSTLFKDVIIFDQNIGIDEMLTPQLLVKSNKAVYTSKSYYNVVARKESVCRSDLTENTILQIMDVYRFLSSFIEQNCKPFSSYVYVKHIHILFALYSKCLNLTIHISGETLSKLMEEINMMYKKAKITEMYKFEPIKVRFRFSLLRYCPRIVYLLFWIKRRLLLSRQSNLKEK